MFFYSRITERFKTIHLSSYSSTIGLIVLSALPLLFALPTFLTLGTALKDLSYNWMGLDASWILALNMALKNGLVFGKEIIFTYGPLAFLATKNDLGISSNYILAFDVFIYLQALIFNFYFLKNKPGRISVFLLIFCYYMLSSLLEVNSMVFFLMLVSVFYCNMILLEKDYHWLLLLSIINSVLLFLIKQNVGLVSIPLLLFLMGILYLNKSLSIKQIIAYLLFLTFCVVIAAHFFRISLIGYIFNSFEIVYGYNYSMYDDVIKDHDFAFEIMLLFILTTFLIFFREVKYKNYLLAILPFIYLFIEFTCYKQSVVRSENILFLMRITPFVFLNLMFIQQGKRYLFTVFVYFLLVGICFYQLSCKIELMQKQGGYAGREGTFAHMRYLANLGFSDETENYKKYCTNSVLPPKILSAIGNFTVDILPWDVSYAFVNGLNYHPRPILQSYQAYTYKLDSLNSRHFSEQSNSPEFLIYSYKSIDQRNPWLEEPRTFKTILANYSLRDTFLLNNELHFLLRKNPKVKSLKYEFISSRKVKLGDLCDLRDDSSVFARIIVRENFFGKLKSLIYKPAVLTITFVNSSNIDFGYRVNMPILNDGINTQNICLSGNELLAYLSQIKPPPSIEHYVSFKILPRDLNEYWTISEEMEVQYYKISSK